MDKTRLTFLLKKYRLTPNKLRGQNFLVSDSVLASMVRAAELSKEDLILEVGPGLGALTAELIQEAGEVVAFEVDQNFQKPLEKLNQVADNLQIIWQDILSLTDDRWQSILKQAKVENYKIVANIPYYLTGKFIQKFILTEHQPEMMVLLVQKEVAERILDNKHSLLSLSVALYAQAEMVEIVDKQNFYPAPQVDSAILRIYNIKSWPWSVNEKQTWQLIHRGFAHKRKKLVNNLLSDTNLNKEKLTAVFAELGLDLNIRAERLSVKDWLNLVEKL